MEKSLFFEQICRFFKPSLLRCLISCFSSLRRLYALFVPCFLIFRVSWFYISWFSVINVLLGLKKMSFCLFWEKKLQKKKLLIFLFHSSLKKKNSFFLLSIANCKCAFHATVSRRSWASQDYVHSVVIHWSRRRSTSVASGRISSFLFLFWEKKA